MNGISYSRINTYQRCPKLYFYKYVMDLQPIKRSVALTQGTDAHGMLKVFFLALQQGRDGSVAWGEVEEHADELADANVKHTFADEHIEYIELLAETLGWIAAYCDQYGEEWTILHVEEEFLIMLEGGEVITFTPDLVVRDQDGYVWIIDHKTTGTIPTSGIPFGDMQALLYYAGIKSLYPECKGFIFNRIRKKTPTQPRLTKTGTKRVASLKTIDTTYEVLRDFLLDEAPDLLDDPTHQKRLAELRDAPERWFWTETVYVNQTTVDSILDDVGWVISQMGACQDAMRYPRNLQEDRGYLSCNRCGFQSLCQADMLGWNTESVIELSYEPREAKNPYEGENDDQD